MLPFADGLTNFPPLSPSPQSAQSSSVGGGKAGGVFAFAPANSAFPRPKLNPGLKRKRLFGRPLKTYGGNSKPSPLKKKSRPGPVVQRPDGRDSTPIQTTAAAAEDGKEKREGQGKTKSNRQLKAEAKTRKWEAKLAHRRQTDPAFVQARPPLKSSFKPSPTTNDDDDGDDDDDDEDVSDSDSDSRDDDGDDDHDDQDDQDDQDDKGGHDDHDDHGDHDDHDDEQSDQKRKRKKAKVKTKDMRVEQQRQQQKKPVGPATANEKKKRRESKPPPPTGYADAAASRKEFPLLNGASVFKPAPVAGSGDGDPNRAHSAQLKAQASMLRRQREQLPIWRHRDSLRQCLHDRDVLVMLGETGSGKSTQIGQFLLHEPWMAPRRVRAAADRDGGKGGGKGGGANREIVVGGCIAITQPRRVAAINLARRVAAEMGVRLGEDVGYSVRFGNRTSKATCIKFLTDGMLLQEMLADPLLKRYSAVVVDEAHERTLGTDMVMGFLKKLVYGDRRGSLKVVVMSATLEVEVMARFFEEKGLLPPPEGAVGDKMEVDESQEASQEAEARAEAEAKEEVAVAAATADGQTPEANAKIQEKGQTKTHENEQTKTNEDEQTKKHENDQKGKRKKKKKKPNGHYNPEDLIREPSPTPEQVPIPEMEDAPIGAIVSTDDGTAVIPYYGTVAAFRVPGRQYPIQIFHVPQPVEDFVEAALVTVLQIHQQEPCPGDVLVFLTGQDEIVTLQKSIEDHAVSLPKDLPKVCAVNFQMNLNTANGVFVTSILSTTRLWCSPCIRCCPFTSRTASLSPRQTTAPGR